MSADMSGVSRSVPDPSPAPGAPAKSETKSNGNLKTVAYNALKSISDAGARLQELHYTAKASVMTRGYNLEKSYSHEQLQQEKQQFVTEKKNDIEGSIAKLSSLKKKITLQLANEKVRQASSRQMGADTVVTAKDIKSLEALRAEVRVEVKRAKLENNVQQAEAARTSNKDSKKAGYLESAAELASLELEIFEDEQKLLGAEKIEIGDLAKLRLKRQSAIRLDAEMPIRKSRHRADALVEGLMGDTIHETAHQQAIQDQHKFCKRLLKAHEGNDMWNKANRQMIIDYDSRLK
jgi:hypothetical protein